MKESQIIPFAGRGILLIFLIFPLTFCMTRMRQRLQPGLSDGLYDSELTTGAAPDPLNSMAGSVRKLFCIDHYITYQFDSAAQVTPRDIPGGRFRKRALGTIRSHETNSATATVVFVDDRRVALLTCAHILGARDTLITYFTPTPGTLYPHIRSIAVRDRQELFVKDIPECGAVKILASDPATDVALIGKECEGGTEGIRLFSPRAGRGSELSWGSTVYLFGYPLGNLTVTRGMVSPLQGRTDGSFTVDALLNKGYSGGLLLAVRDGLPNFEVVGMVRSMSVDEHYLLRPEKEVSEIQYSAHIPYQEPVYAVKQESVNYGINYVVPVEMIRRFYLAHRNRLIREGYNLDDFFNRDPEKN